MWYCLEKHFRLLLWQCGFAGIWSPDLPLVCVLTCRLHEALGLGRFTLWL